RQSQRPWCTRDPPRRRASTTSPLVQSARGGTWIGRESPGQTGPRAPGRTSEADGALLRGELPRVDPPWSPRAWCHALEHFVQREADLRGRHPISIHVYGTAGLRPISATSSHDSAREDLIAMKRAAGR